MAKSKTEEQRLVDAMRKQLAAGVVQPIMRPLYERKIAEYVSKGLAS